MICFILLKLSLTTMALFAAILARPLEQTGLRYDNLSPEEGENGGYDRANWRQNTGSTSSIATDRILAPELVEDRGQEASAVLRGRGGSILGHHSDLVRKKEDPENPSRSTESDVPAIIFFNEQIRPGDAQNIESSTEHQQSSELEDVGNELDKANREEDVVHKMNKAKRARLRPRQETPQERELLQAELLKAEKQLETFREGYRAYAREWIGANAKVKRAKLKAGQLPAEEIRRMENLRKSYNGFQRTQYKIIKLKSRLGSAADIQRLENRRQVNNALKRSTYHKKQVEAGLKTPEELAAKRLEAQRLEAENFDTVYEGYCTFKREYGGSANQSKRERLTAGQGEPEEIQRFDSLRKLHNTFIRLYRRQQQAARAARFETGYHTAEELEQLEALREDHNTYQREYAKNPAELARLKAGKAKPDEIKRFEALRTAYNAFKRLYQRGVRRGKTTTIKFDPSLLDDVEQLEALREEHNTYVREFLGESKRAKRAALESGHGSREEVERFKALQKSFRAYRRAYWRMSSKAEKSKQEPSQDELGEHDLVEIRGVGRARYLTPYYKERRKSRKNKLQSEQDQVQTEETDDTVEKEVSEVSTGETRESNKGTKSPENPTRSQFFSKGIPDIWSSISAGSSRIIKTIGSAAIRAQDAATGNGASSSMLGRPTIPSSGLPKLLPRVPRWKL